MRAAHTVLAVLGLVVMLGIGLLTRGEFKQRPTKCACENPPPTACPHSESAVGVAPRPPTTSSEVAPPQPAASGSARDVDAPVPDPTYSYPETSPTAPYQQVMDVRPAEAYGQPATLPACYKDGMTIAEARACPLPYGAVPERIAFDQCTKLNFAGCVDGYRRMPCQDLRENGWPVCKWAKKQPSKKCLRETRPANPVFLYQGGVQAAVNSYGASWVAAAGVFKRTYFNANKNWYKQEAPLEGATFHMQVQAHTAVLKAQPVAAYWVRHLGWMNEYLTHRFDCDSLSATTPADRRRWEWCRSVVRDRLQTMAKVKRPAVPPSAAVEDGSVKVLVPFYWEKEVCNMTFGDRAALAAGKCYVTGRVIQPEERLTVLKLAMDRAAEVFGKSSVVLCVCHEHTKQAVLDAGVKAGEIAVLPCDTQGPKTRPTLLKGVALPWLTLEYGQANVDRWGCKHVVWLEGDQMVEMPAPAAILRAATEFPARVVVPHRLEEYFPGPVMAGEELREPAYPKPMGLPGCGSENCTLAVRSNWYRIGDHFLLSSTSGALAQNCTFRPTQHATVLWTAQKVSDENERQRRKRWLRKTGAAPPV
eukprot:TRINITY_DN46985_c0_g1_i1.p1 TRINITY_DN46985_c0_g1~~TRINITY_DN46985_c0_g1_i1.p1  ORF type:complete len:589 (+),score=168.25 TRINITY_DN46985_c0_g1_i1:154-1920(+)